MSHCTFILARHGETYWNQKRRMQGQVNIPLNENGISQAERLAEKLRPYDFDICYSSPLARSLRTAEIICNSRNVAIIKDDRLVEQSYGICEGQPQKIVFNVPFCRMYHYVHNTAKYKAPTGGESFEDMILRGGRVIREIMEPAASKYNTVLISGHGAILCSIFCNIENIPVSEFWKERLDNCGYAVVEWTDGQWLIKGRG